MSRRNRPVKVSQFWWLAAALIAAFYYLGIRVKDLECRVDGGHWEGAVCVANIAETKFTVVRFK